MKIGFYETSFREFFNLLWYKIRKINDVFKTFFICVGQLISLIIKLQMQKKIVVFFLEFNIHLFTVDLFQYMTKEKKSLFHVKTD